jgi:hypothetical protein
MSKQIISLPAMEIATISPSESMSLLSSSAFSPWLSSSSALSSTLLKDVDDEDDEEEDDDDDEDDDEDDDDFITS